MNRNLMLLLLTVSLALSMGGITDAFATHNSGYVKEGATGIDDAKVTFEKVGEYEYDRTSSSGLYGEYLPSGSSGWYVDAMANVYDRDTTSGISQGDSYNFDLSDRSNNTLDIKIAPDSSTGVTAVEARAWVNLGEPWYEEEHTIIFDEWQATESWTSAGASSSGCADVLSELNSDIAWLSANDYDGADILIGFTDGKMSGPYACMNNDSGSNPPTSGGNHPYVVVDQDSSDLARSVMHEISHAYGFDHVDATCSGQIPGIMATASGGGACSNEYIKNWVPADDVTLDSRRGWY